MKQSGTIELQHGELVPNSRPLWFTAKEKLMEAQVAIQQMETAHDRIGYESGWIRFVESLQEARNSLEKEGEQTFGDYFKSWFGNHNSDIKNDPLLQYLYQARHQSQHGRISLEWDTSVIHIAPEYYGHISELKIFHNGSFEVEAHSLGDAFNKVKLIQHDTGKAILPIIRNTKHKQEFPPPKEHMGIILDSQDPINIAKIGVKYYRNLIELTENEQWKK